MPMPLSGGGHLSRRAGDEQLVRRKGKAFQFAFATEATELLPQNEEFLLEGAHHVRAD